MNHKHAVAALSNGNTYGYDANGNMTQRVVGGQSYTLSYDAENHMTGVSGAAAATFTYNGDGQRIVASEGVTTTVYLGNYVELARNSQTQTAKVQKYYYAGTTRVAMRQGNAAPLLVLGDHLGSTSRVLNYDGSPIPADQLYYPWGETRFTNGTMPTQYQFTGQYRQAAIGLDYFNARWYDPALGRFSQPDTVIPEASQGVLAWDRYAAMNNSPVMYTDPTGHMIDDGCETEGCTGNPNVITHTVLIKQIPGKPHLYLNAGKAAEDGYCYNCPSDPFSAAAEAIALALITKSTSSYNHAPNEISVFLHYTEAPDQTISVGSLEIWNDANTNISVNSVGFSAERPEDIPLTIGPQTDYKYDLHPPTIGPSGYQGLGVVPGGSKATISLVPSGEESNPVNTFPASYSVTTYVILAVAGAPVDNGTVWPIIRYTIE